MKSTAVASAASALAKVWVAEHKSSTAVDGCSSHLLCHLITAGRALAAQRTAHAMHDSVPCRLLWVVCTIASLASLPTAQSDASSFQWGTYRPNLYFGVRAKNESSPLFGLLWGGPFDNLMHVQELRHDAEERDNISKYGWLQHDGDSFGVQEILDKDKNVNMTTTFLNVSRHTHTAAPQQPISTLHK